MMGGGREGEERAAREEVMEDCSGKSDQQAQPEPEKFKDPPLEEVQVGKNLVYTIKRKLGGGGFGVVYVGESADGTTKVAVKFEHIKKAQEGEPDPDPDEWLAYKDLGGIDGIPHVHYEGRHGGYYVLIMDLLGLSLRDLQKNTPEIVTNELVKDIAVQTISILEKVHSSGYVHSDIKPNNLLINSPGTPEQKLFLVDLGLATKWRKLRNDRHEHVEYDQQPNKFRGTVDYASVHMHLGRTASRRDDLESLAYTLILLLRGSLPWQEQEGENKRDRYLVCDKKMSTSTAELCCSLPQAFKEFLDYVVGLRFDEDPDYEGCILLFKDHRSICRQPVHVRTGKPDNTQWISVYDVRQPMKQRYHYGVEHSKLDHFINKGKEERLFISSVTSCNNLWALIIDGGTNFSGQIYRHFPSFLDKPWIEKQWGEDYRITSIAGAENGSLIVMSRGTQYIKQEYKVDDSFPFAWVKKRWEKGLSITSVATAGSKWAVVMSHCDLNFEQVVEFDFVYPFEGIHWRWSNGFRITAIGATPKQTAFVFTRSKGSPDKPRQQDTYRTYDFPSKYIKEKWARNIYITSLCYGRTVS